MGNNPSQATKAMTPKEEVGPLHSHWNQLYLDLSDFSQQQHDVAASNEQKAMKERFELLFGGPSVLLGQNLYQYYFHQKMFSQDTFMVAMEAMKSAIVDDKNPAEFFIRVILSDGNNSYSLSDMQSLISVCASCSLSVGCHSNLSIPADNSLLKALSLSLYESCQSCEADKRLSVLKYWISHHTPGLFSGVLVWLTQVIHPLTLDDHPLPVYQLPSLPAEQDEDELYHQILIWLLSCSLHVSFMGASQLPEASAMPAGGVWSRLYSSSCHGFSLNRFKHHCYDYRNPSVMLLSCTSSSPGSGGSMLFAVALDTEWKDGNFYYGGENFKLVQLSPTYSVLAAGGNLLSLNDKQRGFPKGLRVRTSGKQNSCIFEVIESLEEARVREGDWMRVSDITVWGCGGAEALQAQQKMKSWAQNEVMRRRQINRRDLREQWMDSPDRAILQMGGVDTDRAKERPI